MYVDIDTDIDIDIDFNLDVFVFVILYPNKITVGIAFMKYSQIVTLLLLISLCGCEYLISKTRTETVAKLCASFPDRNAIISEQDKTEI